MICVTVGGIINKKLRLIRSPEYSESVEVTVKTYLSDRSYNLVSGVLWGKSKETALKYLRPGLFVVLAGQVHRIRKFTTSTTNTEYHHLYLRSVSFQWNHDPSFSGLGDDGDDDTLDGLGQDD